FQAEDGIRDFHVTGVQTCALPILVMHLDVMRNKYRRDVNDSLRSGHTNFTIAHRVPGRVDYTPTGGIHDYRRIRTKLTTVIPAIDRKSVVEGKSVDSRGDRRIVDK